MSCMVTKTKLQCTCFFNPRNEIEYQPDQTKRVLLLLLRCVCFLKKNLNASRPSEHLPVKGGKMPKRLGGIIGCKYKTSSWHLNGFPDGSNIVSTV